MAESIGVISEGAGTITVRSQEGVERDVEVGGQIFEGDVVTTSGAGSYASVSFTNGCQMSLGANESGLVDETVYSLEFYDDADVVADIDDIEEADKAAAEAEVQEEGGEAEVAAAAGAEEMIEEVEDLSELEATAAGEETTQVDEAGIEERTEVETGGPAESRGGGADVSAAAGAGAPASGRGSEPFGVEVQEEVDTFHKDVPPAETAEADTTPPEAPSIGDMGGLVGLDGVGVTNDNTPTLSGTAEPGTTIIVYDDFDAAAGKTITSTGLVKIGEVTVGEDGTWSFTPVALGDGTHVFSLQVVDTAGNSTMAPGILTLVIDTAAPDVPGVDSIDLTNVTTPTISGSAEAGSTVAVTIGSETYTVTADENGSWSLTTAALGDGTHAVSAVATDTAGNVSAAGSGSVTIDTTAPDAPVVTELGLTNDATPEISGTAEAGSTVTIYDGSQVLGTTTAGEDGSWSFTPVALADGEHEITAVLTDAAENASGSSDVQTLVVDTAEPEVPVVDSIDLTNETTPTVTGRAEAGSTVTVTVGEESYTATADEEGNWAVTTGTLSDGTHEITATVTDAAGNESVAGSGTVTVDTTAPDAPVVEVPEITNESIPTIRGSAEAGSTITIYDGDSQLGSTTAGEDGSWSFTPVALADGEHEITAVLTDAAGNVSGSSVIQILVIDTIPPEVPVVESIALTSIPMPTISGTAEAGSTVNVVIGDGSYTVTAAEDGSWSVTTDALADGTYSVTATVTDAAGNVSAAGSGSVTVDATAPDAPVIAAIGLTNDATPEISGMAEAGTTVTIYGSGEVLGTTTAGEDGSWSFTPETLADGEYDITATLTDTAGNISGTSAVQSLIVDTAVPDAPVVTEIDLSSITTPVISGSAEAGSTVSITVGENSYNVTADSEGSWSVTTGVLGDGSYTVSATVTDAAGNVSDAALATIYLDTSSVAYMIDYDNVTISGDVYGIEETTLYGIKADAGFDPDSDILDLSLADEGYVTEHNKGFGVEGGHGEKKAINADEALVVDLGQTTDSIDISLNKMAFFESGRWIAYDENGQKVGEDSFSLFDSLFGGDDNYDYNFWGNTATLSIDEDDVSGDFQYIVFTTGDGFLGQVSDYFVQDVSYVMDDQYSYTMSITGVPSGDEAQTSLLIGGLDEGMALTDAEGNSVGSFENGNWMLGEDEINSLSSGGVITLQVVADDLLDPSAPPALSFTVTETSVEGTGVESFAVADTSYGGEGAEVFDFDSVKQIDLSDNEEEGPVSLDLGEVLQFSDGSDRLGITSSEENQRLSLDASQWEVKTDTDGNAVTVESDGASYTVYASTDADNPFDLIIDQNITIVLENE